MSSQPISASVESSLIDLNLNFNNKNFILSLFDAGNNSIKIIAKANNKDNNDIISFNKYEIVLTFEELKSLNRYFRMFDTFEDAKNNIIELCRANLIQINKIEDNEIIINLDLRTVENNLMRISLNKINNDIKEDMENLIKGYHQQNKEIKELKNTIKEMNSLINYLVDKIEKLEKNSENNRNELINSRIIKNNEELMLLYKAISSQPNKLSLQLLFNSEIDGENTEKLKSSYLGKNDVIILVQTKKDKRFGGYAHESFQNENKKDLKAFLFNLDKMKIYKSKGGSNSIWINEGNSIDFGNGTDLRIYYEFLKLSNYTNQGNNDDYIYDEKFALNGEKYFEIKYLEIYKVILN